MPHLSFAHIAFVLWPLYSSVFEGNAKIIFVGCDNNLKNF